MRFAFEACVSGGGERKVIEAGLLYDLLRALTASDDSDDITQVDVQRLVAKAKKAVEKQKAEEAKATSLLAKGVSTVTTLLFKGMLNKAFNNATTDEEVNFSEFFAMMTDDETKKFLPDGSFITAAFKIRVLKYAFGLIDENGDGVLTFDEFSQASDALSTSKVSQQLAIELWSIVAPGKAMDDKAVISFFEFVTGMAEVQNDPVYSKKFDLFETNVLLSMIIDLPVSAVEEQQLLAGMAGIERWGMGVAKRADHHAWPTDKRNEVMTMIQKKQVHMLTDDQTAAMDALHRRNVLQGAAAGFISAVFCALFENFLTWWLHTDGVENPFHCVPEQVADFPECAQAANESAAICGCIGPKDTRERMDPLDTGVGGPDWHLDPLWPYCDWKGILPFGCIDTNTGSNDACDYITAGQCQATTDVTVIATFWGILVAAIIVACIVEIGALYWYSIKNSVLVADALNMHLDPLNKDRAFVGLSLVRAALELGSSNTVLFGIDPLKETKDGSALMVALFTLMYKAKIVLTGFVMKIAIKRVLGRGGAKYALPWAAVPATAFWDGMVSHLCIVEAKLRGTGVATSVEVFQDILYDLDTSLGEESEVFKMQMIRAVGCNITKGRTIYPAKEILLRHIVSELGFMKLLEEKESGDLDNVELFLATMEELTAGEMKVILEILVLVTVLDGSANKRERRLYEAALHVCSGTPEGKHFVVHEGRVRKLAQDYRNLVPITKAAIQACLDDSEMKMPISYYWNECVHWLCSLLICI